MNKSKIAELIRNIADDPNITHDNAIIMRDIADGLDLPEPKPEPELPTFKEGDWVEYEGTQYCIRFVPDLFDRYVGKTIDDIYDKIPADECHNIRKLDPRDIKVKVTMKGTVSRAYDGACHDNKYFCFFTPNMSMVLSYDDIAPATAETIRELIKAQEEK